MCDWIGIEEVVAIVDAGSFAGAARALGTSTSHISRAVAELEQKLQGELFHRTTRKVGLTDLGRTLVEHFRRLIQDRDEALAWASGDGEPHGELRISCSIALGERFVAPIVRRFAQRFPALSVTMDLSNRMVDIIAEGYDLAIRTGQLGDPRLTGTRLASRKLILCASRDYVEHRGAPQSIAALAEFDCLVGSAQTWHFRDQGRDIAYRPSGRWRCNSGVAVLDAMLADMGISQLPEFYLKGHIGQELVELLPQYRVADEPIWGAYSRRRHLTPKLRQMLAYLAEGLGPALDTDGAAMDYAADGRI